MTQEIFVDTGAWVALADVRDQHHQRASAVYPSLLKRYRLVTHNLIVAEAYILIRLALGHAAAITFLDSLSSPRILLVRSDAALEADAVKILKKYRDQTFSYADAVSFALMRRRGINEAFAFDKHFATAGFICVPPP